MDTLKAIFSRKSVRSYNGEISEGELKTILKAAYAAPIGRALYENVHMTVISNKELLSQIDKYCAELFQNPQMQPLYNAHLFVLVSAKLNGNADNVGYSNCAIVVQNMALAAVELGIGACHIWGAVRAILQNKELLAKLNLPEGFTPCCGIILGKTNETYTERQIPEGRIKTDFIR